VAFSDYDSIEYENLAMSYEAWVSREFNIDISAVDLQGNEEYAERFEMMLDILFAEDKPDDWQELIGDLGFDAEWWDFYHDS
jgi:hypothetical protein